MYVVTNCYGLLTDFIYVVGSESVQYLQAVRVRALFLVAEYRNAISGTNTTGRKSNTRQRSCISQVPLNLVKKTTSSPTLLRCLRQDDCGNNKLQKSLKT